MRARLCFIVGPLAIAAPIAAAAPASYTFQVVQHTARPQADPDGASGTRFVNASALTQNGSQVGSIYGFCITITAASAECVYSFLFPNGSVSTVFPVELQSTPFDVPFAIFGGTRSYAGTTGSGSLEFGAKGLQKVTLSLDMPERSAVPSQLLPPSPQASPGSPPALMGKGG
jgi:hypothetical protein